MNIKRIEWVLRIGTFGTFVGHGILAASIQPNWINYLNTVGFSDDMAIKIMPVIGSIDILVALIVLIKPVKPVVIYAAIWAFLTALMRPISGEPILEFVERTANWAVPLALYFLLYKKNAAGN